MAREFSCFGVLLWQRELSAEARKLEEKKSTSRLSTNQLERPGHCCEAVIGPANRKTSRSQLYSRCVFETSMESPYGGQVYSASRISLLPCCVLVFLVMKCYLCSFSLIFHETAFSLVPLCIQVSFLFHLLFISAFCPALGLETATKQTFRNGQPWQPWLGLVLYPGSGLVGTRASPRRWGHNTNSAGKCIKDQKQSSVSSDCVLCPWTQWDQPTSDSSFNISEVDWWTLMEIGPPFLCVCKCRVVASYKAIASKVVSSNIDVDWIN